MSSTVVKVSGSGMDGFNRRTWRGDQSVRLAGSARELRALDGGVLPVGANLDLVVRRAPT